MKAIGSIYTASAGWEPWEHTCSATEIAEIMERAREIAARRLPGGPIGAIEDEINLAGDIVLRIRRGMPTHGDRRVDRIEFAPGERHLI